MNQDQTIMGAVSRIKQRAERQQDIQTLMATFVDIGILPRLLNNNNQIIYGRRGTGKTHLLKMLELNLSKNNKNALIYIDARVLGSTTQFSDTSISLRQRCTVLFRDILAEINNGLLEYIANNASAEKAFEELNIFSEVITESIKNYEIEKVVNMQSQKQDSVSSLDAVIKTKNLGFETKLTSGKEEKTEKTTTYNVKTEDKIIFPDLKNNLDKVLKKANTTLYILLDEWSSLPRDIQPYLAEFFKRGFLTNSNIVVKIASLEYKSNFCHQDEKGFYGFELGADISVSCDIDDYYVYDRNPRIITDKFLEILFKHLLSELPDDYFKKVYNIAFADDFESRMFTNKNVFEELVRASEGVIRDLINIFTNAFFDSHRKNQDKIDKKSILEAARQWFEQDKSRNLDDELHNILRKIIDEVIGKKKAKAFLIPRDLEKKEIIQKLFDSRVLHLLKRGYADKDTPGMRYNIYTLDYGTYVDLINTSKQPDIKLEDVSGSEYKEMVVPFDDKRSIRRIILKEEFLK